MSIPLPRQVFTPSVFGDVSLVSVAAAPAASGGTPAGPAASSASTARQQVQDVEGTALAEGSAESGAAPGGRVEEFTAAQHAARRGVQPAAVAAAGSEGAPGAAGDEVEEEEQMEEPPTEVELR